MNMPAVHLQELSGSARSFCILMVWQDGALQVMIIADHVPLSAEHLTALCACYNQCD